MGKAADKGMYNAVDSLVRDYPQTVFYRKRLERPEVKSLMEQCNCVVCASRDDPMPTFVTEGLIFGKPSIVSEHTGTAGLVTEGVDGFLYKDDDPQQLADKLAWAIEHPEALAAMHGSCRRLYEQQFSNESYVATLTRLVKRADGRGRIMKKHCRTAARCPALLFHGRGLPILSNPPNCPTKFRFRSQRAAGDVLYWFQNFRL